MSTNLESDAQIIAEMNTSQTKSSQPNDVDKMLDYMKQTFPSPCHSHIL